MSPSEPVSEESTEDLAAGATAGVRVGGLFQVCACCWGCEAPACSACLSACLPASAACLPASACLLLNCLQTAFSVGATFTLPLTLPPLALQTAREAVASTVEEVMETVEPGREQVGEVSQKPSAPLHSCSAPGSAWPNLRLHVVVSNSFAWRCMEALPHHARACAARCSLRTVQVIQESESTGEGLAEEAEGEAGGEDPLGSALRAVTGAATVSSLGAEEGSSREGILACPTCPPAWMFDAASPVLLSCFIVSSCPLLLLPQAAVHKVEALADRAYKGEGLGQCQHASSSTPVNDRQHSTQSSSPTCQPACRPPQLPASLLFTAAMAREAPGADVGGEGAPMKGIAEGGWRTAGCWVAAGKEDRTCCCRCRGWKAPGSIPTAAGSLKTTPHLA